jgi:hypothetical protein
VSKVCCVWPDGESFYVKRDEAEAFVQDGAAVQDVAVQRGESWAQVALSDISG